MKVIQRLEQSVQASDAFTDSANTRCDRLPSIEQVIGNFGHLSNNITTIITSNSPFILNVYILPEDLSIVNSNPSSHVNHNCLARS